MPHIPHRACVNVNALHCRLYLNDFSKPVNRNNPKILMFLRITGDGGQVKAFCHFQLNRYSRNFCISIHTQVLDDHVQSALIVFLQKNSLFFTIRRNWKFCICWIWILISEEVFTKQVGVVVVIPQTCYLGSFQLISQPRHRLSWLRSFVVFLSPSRQRIENHDCMLIYDCPMRYVLFMRNSPSSLVITVAFKFVFQKYNLNLHAN